MLLPVRNDGNAVRASVFARHAQVLPRLFLYLFVRDENSTAALHAAGMLGDLAKARIT